MELNTVIAKSIVVQMSKQLKVVLSKCQAFTGNIDGWRIQFGFSSLPQFALRYQLNEILVFHENLSYISGKWQALINIKPYNGILKFIIYI